MPFDMPAIRHDWALWGEAVVLGLLTALTSFRVFIRALRSEGAERTLWLGLTSVIAGLGIWATNFSAILAFDSGLVPTYSPAWAASSLVAAVGVAAGLGPVVKRPGRWQPSILGGIYTGVVLATLQVVSVEAWIVPATLAWNKAALLAAVVAGASLATAALLVALPSRRWWERTLSAGLLTAAVASQHAISMAGLHIEPDPTVAPSAQGLSQGHMAVAVAAVTLFLAGAAFVLAAFDRRYQRVARQRMRELADAALEGLVMCENGVILDANAGFADLVGLERNRLRGRAFTDFVGREHRPLLPDAAGELKEVDLVSHDGAVVPAEMVGRDLGRGRDRRRVWAVRDVRGRKEAEERIRHLAYHDGLTGLPNRVMFRECLDGALARGRREGQGLALFCLDLDHFKTVNDTLGHPVGDALLRAAAERLQGAVRDGDTVARLGGDEFVVVLPAIEQPEEAGSLASHIVDIVSAPYDLDGRHVIVGASIGIALAPDKGTDPDLLLKNADMALYRAKAEGRRTFRFFEPDMDARLQARRALELDLRQSFSDGEFELFYQPLVNLESNQTSGCEALLRWRHPVRGMVSPADFIPVAEEIGLIVPLGEWVLRQACAEAARWPDHLKVAVNLSPAQFKSASLVQTVVSALAASGLPACRLELEITESVLLHENDTNLATLHRLRALGVRISMDDFGTGYSSLSYLRQFPFDKIKIDRSFVKDLPECSDCVAIIRAVTGLGSSLGMTTTAEGVETEAQLERLRREGCTEVQGFLVSRPVPARDLGRFLEPRRDGVVQAA